MKNTVLLALFCLFGQLVAAAGNVSPLPIDSYQNPNTPAVLSSIANLSGITYNWVADQYITVHQNQYCRFDSQLVELGCGSLACGDCEDITFLGTNGAFYEYALVEEGGAEGSVIIAQSPIDTHNIRLDQIEIQTLIYANTAGGDAGEGVAFDPFNDVFYVCIEDPQMQVLQFNRPANSDDATFADGSLLVSETLSFTQLSALMGAGADLSSCYYDEGTGRLLLMSHTAHRIIDVDLTGQLFAQLDLPQNQVEGFTFNADFNQLITVSEPNNHQIYHGSDVIFANGFQ